MVDDRMGGSRQELLRRSEQMGVDTCREPSLLAYVRELNGLGALINDQSAHMAS